jgi:hypothetical protein
MHLMWTLTCPYRIFCAALKHADLVTQSQVLELKAARERKIEERVARSVVIATIMGENYEKKYNPHPLRYFEIFERHSRQLLRAFTDRRPSGTWLGYWSQGRFVATNPENAANFFARSLGESQRLSGANFPERDFGTTSGASFWCGSLFNNQRFAPEPHA